MGYLFHPRRVDHGIDGHIDLVAPGTQEVLNLVLLVQSKASGLPFTYETDASFQYTCNENDLNYWLSGNAPVILILSHPERDEAWWVEVKAELADPKRRASRTVVVDKHRQVVNASAAPQLLRRTVPKDKGVFLATPPKPDPDHLSLLKRAVTPPPRLAAGPLTAPLTAAPTRSTPASARCAPPPPHPTTTAGVGAQLAESRQVSGRVHTRTGRAKLEHRDAPDCSQPQRSVPIGTSTCRY